MSEASSENRVRRLVVQGAGLVLSIAAIALLASTVPLEETGDALRTASWPMLAAGAGIVLVQLLVVTQRWAILLGPVTPNGSISARRLIGPVLLGYLGNFLLPARLGEAVRALVASRRERIPFLGAVGSVVLDRVVDTSVLAAVALLVAIGVGAPGWVVQVAAIAAAASILALVVLASPLAARAAGLLGRIPVGFVQAVARAVEGFLRGAGAERRATAIATASLLSAASWLLEGTVYWLVATSIGIDIGLPQALLVAAVTILATAVPSAPAYVGTFELAVTAVATSFGVPAADALAWGLLAHAVTAGPLAIGGVLALLRSGLDAGGLIRDAAETDSRLGEVASAD